MPLPLGSRESKACIRRVIREIDKPSWVGAAPEEFGEAVVGTLKTAEWKILYFLYIPFALVFLWGHDTATHHIDETHQQHFKALLDMTMSLVSAFLILGKKDLNQASADAYRKHLVDWRKAVDQQLPYYRRKPTWHAAFHIWEFILLFGPAYSWWCFVFERLIGSIQRIPRNHIDCEFHRTRIFSVHLMNSCIKSSPRRLS